MSIQHNLTPQQFRTEITDGCISAVGSLCLGVGTTGVCAYLLEKPYDDLPSRTLKYVTSFLVGGIAMAGYLKLAGLKA